jgi:hypothetical protein
VAELEKVPSDKELDTLVANLTSGFLKMPDALELIQRLRAENVALLEEGIEMDRFLQKVERERDELRALYHHGISPK